jgi:hypothetical protein
MVEEWSSADTGVGPAMASGSQVWSGNWPDLPIAAMKSATPAVSRTVLLASPESAQPEMAKIEKPSLPRCSCAHAFEAKNRMDTPTSRPTSPTRTVKNAFMAARALA